MFSTIESTIIKGGPTLSNSKHSVRRVSLPENCHKVHAYVLGCSLMPHEPANLPTFAGDQLWMLYVALTRFRSRDTPENSHFCGPGAHLTRPAEQLRTRFSYQVMAKSSRLRSLPMVRNVQLGFCPSCPNHLAKAANFNREPSLAARSGRSDCNCRSCWVVLAFYFQTGKS